MDGGAKIRVLIVDDHEVVCRGTKLLLEEDPLIAVVGVASDGESALELLEQQEIDVVLMDINMSGLNGIETTRLARKLKPELKIIAFSGYNQEQYVFALFKAGARGYILKTASQRELTEAIIRVHSGLPAIDSSITRHQGAWPGLLAQLADSEQQFAVGLTGRELDILGLLAQGMSNKEIGKLLSLSPRTVEYHVANVLTKLGVQSRLNAVLEARKRGLISGLMQ